MLLIYLDSPESAQERVRALPDGRCAGMYTAWALERKQRGDACRMPTQLNHSSPLRTGECSATAQVVQSRPVKAAAPSLASRGARAHL